LNFWKDDFTAEARREDAELRGEKISNSLRSTAKSLRLGGEKLQLSRSAKVL